MKTKRIQIKLTDEEDKTLRELAAKTGLKMNTILTQGLQLVKEKCNE